MSLSKTSLVGDFEVVRRLGAQHYSPSRIARYFTCWYIRTNHLLVVFARMSCAVVDQQLVGDCTWNDSDL